MTNSIIPPGLLLMFGGLLLPLMSDRVRKVWILVLPMIVMGFVWMAPEGVSLRAHFLGLELQPLKSDNLSRLFATIFTLMAGVGGLYALNQKRVMELTAAFIYAGGAIGVAMSGDLVSVFIYWELMAVASTLVIWSSETVQAYRASIRYLLVHLLGGVILMIGVVGYIVTTGSTEFVLMTPHDPWTWAILVGFLINAGAPPLSAWLPDAYPEASWSGSVFLSAFTTKTAVYVLMRGFAGTEILIFVGLYMVFYGIIYALLENDMRRILAYSIINQVGFMVTGIGIGTEMALNGAAAHAFAHIIYKALLLMSAGAVYYQTGKRRCTDLGGLYQSMPLTMICGTIGALAISAFPWTSGFVTKSMISQAAADEHLMIAWFILTAASAGVFLHAGIKFPWFVFFQKDSGLRPKDPPWNMRLAMVIFSALCIGIGIYPDPLYSILPYKVEYHAYSGAHVVTMLQLLLFSGFAFFVLLPMMKRTLTITLDFDWFYRKFLVKLADEFTVRGGKVFNLGISGARAKIDQLIAGVFKHHGPSGAFARTWATSSMVIWVAVLLCAYLIIYYL